MKRISVGVLLILAGTAVAQQSEYGGPAILSRGIGPGLRSSDELIKMRFYAQVNGLYETGLSAVSVDDKGQLADVDAYGVQGTLGAYGYHQWKRTLLGLNYQGSYNHYTSHTYYDGTDQSLSLGLTRQLSKHVSLSLREIGGTSSRPMFGYVPYGFTDPSLAGVPVNELYDGRVYWLNTMADLTYQKSARLSFNFGGSEYFLRRRSKALVGLNSSYARGDMSYRLSRTQTIGVDYVFSHYDYERGFGSTDAHGVALDYSIRFARHWDFSLRAGGTRVESLGLIQVQIDPAVAAIIGVGTGTEIYYRTIYIPSGGAQLFHSFHRSSFSMGYNRGISPGNGIFLTSQSQSASANYSYTGLRRWSFGLGGSWESYSSLGRTLGKYDGYGANIGTGYRIASVVHLTTRIDYRRYEVEGNNFRRDRMSASVGLAFAPGDIPLSLW